MLKVIFYLKNGKVNKKGEYTIYARLSYNQKSTTIAIRKSIAKERWLFTNHLRNSLKLEKKKIIKSSLDAFQLHAEKKFIELFKIDTDVLLELLKAELTGKTTINTKQITILDVCINIIHFLPEK